MLQLSASLQSIPILSLRTGTQVASTIAPLVNPDNFKIEGFFCEDAYDKTTLILLCQDIRETIPAGIAINDHEVLVEPSELVRFKDIIELAYQIIGKPVQTVSKQKIGKVSDYATDMSSMYIQKLYVTQPLFKSLTSGDLLVDRSQINEVTPRRIIIEDLLKTASANAPATL